MAFRKRLNSREREKLYDRVLAEQRESAPGKKFPDCNICNLPILPGHEWDESHWPIPRSFGGKVTGIAHRYRCNRRHGQKVVTPLLAKSNRTRQRHIGAYRAQSPMRGGRDDRLKKKLDGSVVLRATGERA